MSHRDFRKQPVPRAASTDKTSPHYSTYTKHIGLKFNGQVITGGDCVGYNADEGVAYFLVRHPDYPRILLKDPKTRALLVEKRQGTVEPFWR
jgi:hypothetical protein